MNYNNAKHIREISMLQTRIVQMPSSSNQDVEVFTVAYYVGTGPTSTNDGFKTIVALINK